MLCNKPHHRYDRIRVRVSLEKYLSTPTGEIFMDLLNILLCYRGEKKGGDSDSDEEDAEKAKLKTQLKGQIPHDFFDSAVTCYCDVFQELLWQKSPMYTGTTLLGSQLLKKL